MNQQAAKEAAEDKASRDNFMTQTAGILNQGLKDLQETITEIKSHRPGEFDPTTYQSPGRYEVDENGVYTFVPNSSSSTSSNDNDGSNPETVTPTPTPSGTQQTVQNAGNEVSKLYESYCKCWSYSSGFCSVGWSPAV